MRRHRTFFWAILAVVILGAGVPLAARGDTCAICGQPLSGNVYAFTDKVTHEQKIVCSDCSRLPLCYICGLPVKDDGVKLPDGRYLCARDGKTVVLRADEAVRISDEVKDDLDRLFSRFTEFPTNVHVSVIDRIDVDSMFHPDGNDFESPNLLGCIRPETNHHEVRYEMRLMTGLPLAELKETCAHEYTHAWVGMNVPPERREKLGRDAEEGFCELVGYLLMDSQQEDLEKQRVLQNRYTRGQIDLFIEAEKRYGFDQVLDWMKYGLAEELEEGHPEGLRDVRMPRAGSLAAATAVRESVELSPAAAPGSAMSAPALLAPKPPPAVLKLDGILWGNPPVAIINGRSFMARDSARVKIGGTNVNIRCLEIQKKSVRLQRVESGKEEELSLPPD